MDITPDFLRAELDAAERRRAQALAELNVIIGQVDVLKALLVRAEEPVQEPRRIGAQDGWTRESVTA